MYRKIKIILNCDFANVSTYKKTHNSSATQINILKRFKRKFVSIFSDCCPPALPPRDPNLTPY
jgi:hypothetical protein